jgi:hypothetical protein
MLANLGQLGRAIRLNCLRLRHLPGDASPYHRQMPKIEVSGDILLGLKQKIEYAHRETRLRSLLPRHCTIVSLTAQAENAQSRCFVA